MRKTVFAVLLCLFVPDARAEYSYSTWASLPPDETAWSSYPTTAGPVYCYQIDQYILCDDTDSDCDDEPAPAPDPATGERSADERDDGEEDTPTD